jgi:hypothetical protein
MAYGKGGDVCKQADGSSLSNNSASSATVYSNVFTLPLGSTFSMHLVWSQTTATYASVVSLWASNIKGPGLVDDTDWVEMTSEYGFDGFPGLTSGALGTSGKDFVDVSDSGALQYRLKFVASGGAADIQCHVGKKDTK